VIAAARPSARRLLWLGATMTLAHGFRQLSDSPSAAATCKLHTSLRGRRSLGIGLGALLALGACGVEPGEPETSEASSELSVNSFLTNTCTTAVVIGLSKQIASEISCMNPTSLTSFAAGSGITITSNAVLPFLAANAKADLQKVGSVSVNSAFRTIAQQYLLLQWFNRGRCGITAAAAVGRSNHESGRAVDLANWSARVSAMSSHHWSHDVPGDPVHFDHLSSADIRGKDVLAFQRLWNRNHPKDLIATDGDYGPQTEARLKQSPATGFATGASCTAKAKAAQIVAADGPDRIAPGQQAHYVLTVSNDTDVDWPATTRLMVADGNASPLYDAATWASAIEIGTIGAVVPAGTQATVDLDVVGPSVATATPIQTQFALMDGTNQVGAVDFAVTITPDGNANTSTDGDDATDDDATGGCAAGGGAAGWLAFAPMLLVLRRRRR
jgi:hypothetical protein